MSIQINGTTALRAFHNGTIVFTKNRGSHASMEPSTENQHRKKGTYGFTHMKPSDGNQHRKKETSPLAHFVRNSLPRKKLPLFLPQCKTDGNQVMKQSDGNQHRKKKLPLLLTSFAIHCLTKASAFVPQCSSGNH